MTVTGRSICLKMAAVCLALLFGLCISPAIADVQISFPLQGWYRPGQYIPVSLLTDGTTGEYVLSSAGTADTNVMLDGGRQRLVVPWLVFKPSGPIAGGRDVNWRPLQPNQRLVGVVGAIQADLQPLFPDRQIIPLALDESVALEGDSVCWQALDAVVMDAEWFHRTGRVRCDALLDAGTVLVVVAPADASPGSEFHLQGGYWVARKALYGPRGAVEGEAAYLPVYGWTADWPALMRQKLFLAAVAVFLLLLIVSRIRGRWTWGVLTLFGLTATAGLVVFATGNPPAFTRQADIQIRTPTHTQCDTWSYQTARQSAASGLRWIGPTWPAIFNAGQISGTHLTLRCGSDGLPHAFAYTLGPDVTLAFLSRRFTPAVASPLSETAHNPMMLLSRRLYPSLIPEGQIASDGSNSWPTLVLGVR